MTDLIKLGCDMSVLKDVIEFDIKEGVIFKKRPTVEQVSVALYIATQMRNHSSRWIGQIIAWCEDDEAVHGEKYSQAVSFSGLGYDTVKVYASVVRALEDRWHPNLGMSFHAAVAPLSPDEQAFYLDLCDPGEPDLPPAMSRAELRKRIQQDKGYAGITFDGPVDKTGHPLPLGLQSAFATGEMIRTLFRQADRPLKEIVALGDREDGVLERPGTERLAVTAIQVATMDLKAAVHAGLPYAVCPYCNGTGCKQCDTHGWMHEDRWNGIPKERRGGR